MSDIWDEYPLSTRAIHALRAAGIKSLKALRSEDILRIPNIGKITAREITEVLGGHLRQSLPPDPLERIAAALERIAAVVERW